MRLIVDGYNAIHQLPQLMRHRDQRSALGNFLAAWKQAHGFRGAITVVFDAQKAVHTAEEVTVPGIRFAFTARGQSADERIVAMVRNSALPRQTTVVSDDNFVANNCRAHGARVEPVRYLLTSRKNRVNRDDKIIDPAWAREINEALKKKWNI